MARKGKKKSRRRFTGINATNAAEAALSMWILTDGLFNTDPLAFLTGKDSTGYFRSDLAVSNTGGEVKIGLGELLGLTGNAQGNWDAAGRNLEANWSSMLFKEIGVAAGFRLGKRLLSKQRRSINAGLRMAGLGTTIRV